MCIFRAIAFLYLLRILGGESVSLSVDSFGRFAVVTWFLNGLSLFHLHLALQFWLFSKFLFVYFSLIDRLSIGLILKGCHVFSVSRLFCPHLFLVGCCGFSVSNFHNLVGALSMPFCG